MFNLNIFNDNEKKFIDILEEAKGYVKGELELDCEDGEWYARDYRKDFEYAFSIEKEPYDNPLITDEEAKEKDINIIKCCDYCDIAYVE